MKDKLDELEQAKQSLNPNAPYAVSQRYTLSPHMVTTAFTLDGFRIVRAFRRGARNNSAVALDLWDDGRDAAHASRREHHGFHQVV